MVKIWLKILTILIFSKFGISLIDGNLTHLIKAPWIASVWGGANYLGVATILSRKTLVLPAEVLEKYKNDSEMNRYKLFIRTGSACKTGGEVSNVDEIIPYNNQSWNIFNIVLIKLKYRLRFGPQTYSIRITTFHDDIRPNFKGNLVSWSDIDPSCHFLRQKIQIENSTICKNYKNLDRELNSLRPNPEAEGIFCFTFGRGILNGDIGAPLIRKGKLVGFLTVPNWDHWGWGEFINIQYYSAWIEYHLLE